LKESGSSQRRDTPQSFLRVAFGSMRAARSVGTDTATRTVPV
jgi:hypothetical protein